MPEYLAPDVYVEEVDTGSKPIEGVSTSTAGMFGMTERGPVDVPIVVTSYGEYVQWFGERLDPLAFPDARCYLPHAVEGFFTNGGKRLYVVRVLDTAAAAFAETRLFGPDPGNTAATRILTGIGTTSPTAEVYVLNDAGLGVTVPPTWVQIGEGSNAEFRTVLAPAGADNDISLQLPLSFAYDTASAHVDHIPAAGFVPGPDTPKLDQPVKPGALALIISGKGTVGPGTIIRLGSSANGDDEYVVADAAPLVVAPAARVVALRTPVLLAHNGGGGATVDILTSTLPALPLPVATPPTVGADRTVLAVPGTRAAAGSSVLFLGTPAKFVAGDFILLSDATHAEIRRIGQLGSMTLAAPAYASYPAGTTVESVSMSDDAGINKTLGADASAGDMVLELTDRDGLQEGDVIRVGLAADPQCEFVVIKQIPNPPAGPNPGKLVLRSALKFGKLKPSEVRRQNPPSRAAPGATALALDTAGDADNLVVGGSTGFNATHVLRVDTGGNGVYYHRLLAVAAQNAKPLTLDSNLALPHLAGESLAARKPLLTVRALDQGEWGNRLRVAVVNSDPPLVHGKIRAIIDATHVRLDSANGVEPGTVLLRVDNAGTTLSAHKVIDIDRQSDFLITLDAAGALPGAAAKGDAVRSQEFQLDVYLLRQPDPGVPSRTETVVGSESFPFLSLDARHSRYVHKVIGSTWVMGATPPVDADDQPLRKSDRRSEGGSWFIRVRDEETLPAKKKLLRLGPTPLFDIMPSGARRASRIALHAGDDAVASVTDASYVGQDNFEPELRTGLNALRNEDIISIVACPGRTSPVLQQALIDHCESMRYRFAVLDGPRPPDDSLADTQSLRQQYDTKYAALYHPWLLIPPPFPVSAAQADHYPIPPSGHVLGVYARTDIERGVHKAPANELVRGIIGLQRRLNKGEHDILNPYPVNINVIRDFRSDSRGIRIYGGRVITSDPDWKYVNVRRLLIFIEASINRGLQFAVFEPNAEPLWARLRRSISNFLTLVWRNGGLEGTRVEEAYFVKCDRTTMTQTDIDSGRLICLVGVAPVKPAEFVIVRIGLWTAHADD
jgi:phage tail sheath protein FI